VEHTFHQDFIQQQIQLDKLSAEAQYTPASEPPLSPPSAAVPHAPRTAPQGAEDPERTYRYLQCLLNALRSGFDQQQND